MSYDLESQARWAGLVTADERRAYLEHEERERIRRNQFNRTRLERDPEAEARYTLEPSLQYSFLLADSPLLLRSGENTR